MHDQAHLARPAIHHTLTIARQLCPADHLTTRDQ